MEKFEQEPAVTVPQEPLIDTTVNQASLVEAGVQSIPPEHTGVEEPQDGPLVERLRYSRGGVYNR